MLHGGEFSKHCIRNRNIIRVIIRSRQTTWINHINRLHDRLESYNDNILTYLKINIHDKKSDLRELSAKLRELSPKAILSRGYSITRTIPDATIVKEPDSISIAQHLEVLVEKGALTVSVLDKADH